MHILHTGAFFSCQGGERHLVLLRDMLQIWPGSVKFSYALYLFLTFIFRFSLGGRGGAPNCVVGRMLWGGGGRSSTQHTSVRFFTFFLHIIFMVEAPLFFLKKITSTVDVQSSDFMLLSSGGGRSAYARRSPPTPQCQWGCRLGFAIVRLWKAGNYEDCR